MFKKVEYIKTLSNKFLPGIFEKPLKRENYDEELTRMQMDVKAKVLLLIYIDANTVLEKQKSEKTERYLILTITIEVRQ